MTGIMHMVHASRSLEEAIHVQLAYQPAYQMECSHIIFAHFACNTDFIGLTIVAVECAHVRGNSYRSLYSYCDNVCRVRALLAQPNASFTMHDRKLAGSIANLNDHLRMRETLHV